MGIVFQDSFLFSNTIAANIAFGHPDASMVQIERAARLAAAADFISEMPEKYESMVGEHGANLSGGQRCGSLARAVCRSRFPTTRPLRRSETEQPGRLAAPWPPHHLLQPHQPGGTLIRSPSRKRPDHRGTA
jgi:hypothetical protein